MHSSISLILDTISIVVLRNISRVHSMEISISRIGLSEYFVSIKAQNSWVKIASQSFVGLQIEYPAIIPEFCIRLQSHNLYICHFTPPFNWYIIPNIIKLLYFTTLYLELIDISAYIHFAVRSRLTISH